MTVGREGETIQLVEQAPTPLGQTLMLEHDGKTHRLALPLIGAYQAANVLVAAGLVLATGGELDATFSAMQRVSPVRGRLERAVISRAGAPVYVDYAHTADALEAAIAALRPHVEGQADHRVRRRRRPRPGQARRRWATVAARLSDVVIVTDDNPRSEDPAQIRARRAGRARRRDRDRRPPRSDRRGDPDRAGAATSSCSPARAMRPARSSATGCFRSTTPLVARECAA